MSTTTAGLERVVCETCGNVSVRFVSEAVKIFPTDEDLHVPGVSNAGARCACGAVASFMTPDGLACAEHAWAAAARQDALGGELWIPIRIDQHSRTN